MDAAPEQAPTALPAPPPGQPAATSVQAPGPHPGAAWHPGTPLDPENAEADLPHGGRPPRARRGPLLLPWRILQWGAGITVLALVAFLAGWAVASDRNVNLLERAPQSAPAGEVPVRVSTMPDLRGLNRRDAVQVLSDLGVDVSGVTYTEQPFAGEGGLVLAQDPVYGQELLEGAIDLEVSAEAVVPPFEGVDAADYVATLQEFGTSVTTESRYTPSFDSGDIVSVSPAPGEPVPTEMTVVTAAAGQFLNLAEAESETYECGSSDQTINGRGYAAELLECDLYDGEAIDEVYLLRRKFARISGVLGVPDDAEQATEAQLEIIVDGRVVARKSAGYGTTTPFDVPLVGALKLTLRFRNLAGRNAGYGTAAIGGGVLEGSQQGINQMQGR